MAYGLKLPGTNLVKLPASSLSPSDGGFLTPRIAYADAVNGNDATAVIGDPSKPFKTAQAAVNAIDSITPYAICALHLRAGFYSFSFNNWTGALRAIYGAGVELTQLVFSIIPSPTIEGPGLSGFIFDIELNDLTVSVFANGGGAGSETETTYPGGEGGVVNIIGNALLEAVSANGGEGCFGGDQGIGGTVRLERLRCKDAQAIGITNGTLSALGVSFYIPMSFSSFSVSNVGNSYYPSSIGAPTNDLGGNAVY